ncbi:MAG: ferredoxin--NADP reductase [Hyphomicrobium sp.]|uniref:ferredoxin--NADP reductase n=1 Tax=Hyphomicrobium sp. TaxID=82 RepID=UPI0039E65B04
MAAPHQETVLSVRHWTERLFSFTTTRDAAFRFNNGQFTMLGLMVGERPLMRAYSIASANHADHLEFLSIKVEGGPLTSRLKSIAPGERIILGKKPTGTLVLDYLLPGKRLYLLATGTGLAPFLSIIRDPFTYEQFDKIVLVHGVRHAAELAYRDYITEELPKDEFLGESVRDQLLYYPTVTREPFHHQGRITAAIESGTLRHALELPELDPNEDRLMICGSTEMLRDLSTMLEKRGFIEGNTSDPGSFVIEKAFAQK